jgi:Uma2 family endonuclease
MLRRDQMDVAMNRQAGIGRPATYQDVLDAPPHMVAEIANGRHARTTTRLGARLDDPFENGVGGPGGWYIVIEPELHLGQDVLVPDLAGWRRERMPTFPDTAAAELAPDWVCEVLSPATRSFDLTEKRELYRGYGVGHLWFVDPQARTLEVFESREEVWVLVAAFKDDDEVRAVPFDAVAFPLSALWPD